MVQRVVYILSKVDKSVAFEWIVEEFKNSEIEFIFILLNDKFNTDLAQFLLNNEVRLYQYKLGQKSSYPSLIIKIFRNLRSIKPKVVHTHLLEASLIGLSAAKLAGIKNRIHTRHHSTSQHEYFPHAVKYDRFNNFMSSNIVAISENVKNVLMELEGLKHEKISLIEHGFKLESFRNIDKKAVNYLKTIYQIPIGKKIIGTISRYLKLKGTVFVIDAFKEVYSKNPDTHLLLANSGGSYEEVIRVKLKELAIGSYTEIKFEPDLFSLYGMIDIFCHVPINSKVEAYGQTYVEALAAGIPSIFTLSGIANDFIEHEKNALVVDYENSLEIENSINRLLKDSVLKEQLIFNGLKSVKRFDLPIMINKLQSLYKN
jgi:glycosyltransferase involved in cell wall biosynthesis